MGVDLDLRIERALARGHPEVDGYDPHGLDLSRRPAGSPGHQRTLVPALAAAVIVMLVIALGSVALDHMRPRATAVGGLGAQESPATPSSPASETPGLVLEVVNDPETELMADLSAGGVRCFAMATHYRIPPNPEELDRQIKEAGIVQGWLIVGSRWLGRDRVALARAFGAIRVVAADHESAAVWILTERDGRLGRVELQATETPRGHLVWDSGNTTFQADCDSPTAPPISIAVVKDPRSAASAEMVKRGVRCFTGSDVLKVFQPEKLDEQIDDAGIDQGWLQAGRIWFGEDPVPMVLALGSSWAVAGPSETELWAIIDEDGTLVSRGFALVETPRGRHVWEELGDADRAATC